MHGVPWSPRRRCSSLSYAAAQTALPKRASARQQDRASLSSFPARASSGRPPTPRSWASSDERGDDSMKSTLDPLDARGQFAQLATVLCAKRLGPRSVADERGAGDTQSLRLLADPLPGVGVEPHRGCVQRGRRIAALGDRWPTCFWPLSLLRICVCRSAWRGSWRWSRDRQPSAPLVPAAPPAGSPGPQ